MVKCCNEGKYYKRAVRTCEVMNCREPDRMKVLQMFVEDKCAGFY